MAALLALGGCNVEEEPDDPTPQWVLATIVSEDGSTVAPRRMYVQALDSLDNEATVTNDHAIEVAGVGNVLVNGRDVLVGLYESPDWYRYTVRSYGTIELTGRLNLASQGITSPTYGNAIVAEDLVVSVSTDTNAAILWNPQTMEVVGQISMPHLALEGFSAEVWTTIAYNGLVYVPIRWTDWEGSHVHPSVNVTILDPYARTIVGTASDDRCANGGRVVFDPEGYAYVMGDGRNYSAQIFATVRGEPLPTNCLLRIPPGGTDFEADFYYEIPALTGGLESAGELETSQQGSGVGFSLLFYRDRLPPGVETTDYEFWVTPSFRTWRIELGDVPVATEVEGLPFSSLGYEGNPVDGHLYVSIGEAWTSSTVYEIDPTTNRATSRFAVDGLFYRLERLPPD